MSFARNISLGFLLALAATGCKTRQFPLYAQDAARPLSPIDSDNTDGGPGFDSLVVPPQVDTGADGTTCIPAREACNEKDDDCDGQTDEGFDFFNDTNHCGGCGNSCDADNAQSVCSAGRCSLKACNPGFVDTDEIELNGCECALSEEGKEICDDIDNDCDGKIDEDFDLASDAKHCGQCAFACDFDHAAPLCADGFCKMGDCEKGWLDLDGSAHSGCEYQCTPSQGGIEICDSLDNDCDGQTDESDPRAGTACFPANAIGCDPASGQCAGPCLLGQWKCLPGGLVCDGAVGPVQESCDAVDNDCDGQTDEDFDQQNDPRWCGGCNVFCDLPQAINGCTEGRCVVTQCRAGFVDLDKNAPDGCEYQCTRDGPEVCDGKDNDCNGLTDESDPDLRFPPQNFCNLKGECGKGPGASARYPGDATYPVCTTTPGSSVPDWYCNYPNTVELFAPNQVLGQETWCDGLDNDCDGEQDEHAQPPVGGECQDDGLGQCQKTGLLRCQSDRTLAPRCDVSAAADRQPSHEVCDDKDNDCDGHTDEAWNDPTGEARQCAGQPCLGVRDDVVPVTLGNVDYFIYRHEASRPDAQAGQAGIAEGRACSRPGVIPWASVTHAQAQSACQGAGMRLCRTSRDIPCSSAAVTQDEWGTACASGAICPQGGYPYGCDFQPQSCNGLDRNNGTVWATQSGGLCQSGDVDGNTPGVQSLSDMSGNLAEWTDDCRGIVNDGGTRRVHTLRGGSFNNIQKALRCDFMSLVVAEDFAFEDTGFRCCSDCPVGRADCDGTCADLGRDNRHCGACGQACADGTGCDNGRCR